MLWHCVQTIALCLSYGTVSKSSVSLSLSPPCSVMVTNPGHSTKTVAGTTPNYITVYVGWLLNN